MTGWRSSPAGWRRRLNGGSLFRFGRGVPRLVHARHDGGESVAGACVMSVCGPGDGGCFGDTDSDNDRLGADVGQALDVDAPLEPGGKAFVHVDVLKTSGAVFADAEPRAMAECVAPGSEFIEARDEILANGAGNQAGFVQDPVEFEGEAAHAVDLGAQESLGPPAHGVMVVRREKGGRPLARREERVAGGCQNVFQVSEGRYRFAEFQPEGRRTLVHRPVCGQIGAVDGQTAAQPLSGLTDRLRIPARREAPDKPCAALRVGALLLPSDAPRAQQPP